MSLHRFQHGRAEQLADPGAPIVTTSIGAALSEQARLRPDGVALIWMQGGALRRMTYGELLVRGESCARWLRSHAEPGEVVAVWSRNCVDWIVVEYGCALAGVILASFNSAWTDYELQHALDLTTPRLVLAGMDSRGGDLVPRVRALAPGLAVEPLEGLSARAADQVTLPDPGPDAPFLIQFTSGTTGRAKGALLSHASALNAAMLRAMTQSATSADIFLNGSPLHHVAGSVSLVLGTMVVGAAYILVERVTPAHLLALLKETGATRLGGVPTVLKDMIEHPDFPPEGFRMTSIGLGGAEVPESLIHRVTAAFHAPVSVGYGQSECALIANSLIDDPPHLIATTVGRAPPQNSVRIVNPTSGAVLGIGEVGEICVRSPANMVGYFRNPMASAEAIDADGWLHTGDLGVLDADGCLQVRGRSREVIIRGGANIYPAEIENVLMQHPAVLAVAAIGTPDERLGQQVAAVVVLREGASATPEALEAFAGERLTHYKTPRQWRFVDALPTTASGKVRKVELADMFTVAQAR